MSYAIIRNANYKKDNLAGLYKHNERKNTNYSNKEIDKSRSANNYSIKTCTTTYTNTIKKLQEDYNLQGRIIKTTNVACELIITSDKEFFERIGKEETKRYFQTAYNFVANYKGLGEQYILSAKVHMDETTPHLHIVFVPVVHKKGKNGSMINKIACSEYWKGKDSYRELQDDFFQYIKDHGFNLERGKSKGSKHVDIETLKQITNYDNIKYELEHEEIKPIETQNTALIVKQNQELVQYTKKLKVQLAKSFHSIQRVKDLEKENQTLKQENQNLKKENSRLKNYIKRAFEAVKVLFDFPIDRFKRLVDGFMEELKK